MSMPEVHRLALADHFQRWPSSRMLLTVLVRLALRSECTCKRCEAKRKREEKQGLCYHAESLKAVRDMLPAWAELEGVGAKPDAQDLGIIVERGIIGG